MKKRMAYILIIVGAILLLSGVIVLMSPDKEVTESAPPIVAQPKTDTVYYETQAPERVIEKTIIVEKQVAATNEDLTDEEIIGQKFEDYVVNLLADSRFRLLDRTMDKKTSEGVYAESCMNPDLHISQAHDPKWLDYYIECKYRASWYQGQVKFENYQIERYHDFQKQERRKVLFALGIGGKPEAPKSLMIVPLDSLKNNAIKQDWVLKYRIDPTPEGLYNYMGAYFKGVFDHARNHKKH